MQKIINWFSNNYRILFKIFLFLITILITVALFPKDYRFKYDFSTNKPWPYEDLIAPFDFAIQKTQEDIDKEKEDIRKEIKPYFVVRNDLAKKMQGQLSQDFNQKWEQKYGDKYTSQQQKDHNYRVCQIVFDSIFDKGIIEVREGMENKSRDEEIMILKGRVAEEHEWGSFFTVRTADQYIQQYVEKEENIDKDLCLSVLENVIGQNVLYNEDQTIKETNDRIGNISLTRGIVQKGERIISMGEIVGQEKFQLLTSLKEEYEGQKGGKTSFLIIMLGQTILISISIVVLILFLLMFRKDILDDNRKLSLILSMILIMVVITSILIRRYGSELVSLAPLCLVPFIIRAFYDTRLGLFVHIITIVIIGFLVPNGYEFVFLQLIAGIVTIISVVSLEKRSQFFLTSIYVFLAYSITYTGMNLAQDGNLSGVRGFNYLLFGGSSALTLLAFPLIYVYEKVFGYVTSLSLLELSSINNKLLRELSLKAPGTFQHSLQVANLSEEAVYRIGGNSILARTGALYHDIGKLGNAAYFTENQIGGINPHNELDYLQSAAIILGHVQQGVELAHKYKLPQPIIDFIRTHHGMSKTGYFFKLFKKEHVDLRPEEEAMFTYSGPLPFSKETAVVMMADAVEASSKSLKQPDKQSISDLVEEIIDRQIEQKQFKNCNITLKDITRIKNVFKHRLMSIYHIRIEYPK